MAKKDGEELQFDIAGEKQKALQAAMDKIEKNYGKGAVMKMGTGGLRGIDVIPSGSIGLNAALGVGGYPRGRIIEIYGPESSGKTTLAIHAIAETQRLGGVAAYSAFFLFKYFVIGALLFIFAIRCESEIHVTGPNMRCLVFICTFSNA